MRMNPTASPSHSPGAAVRIAGYLVPAIVPSVVLPAAILSKQAGRGNPGVADHVGRCARQAADYEENGVTASCRCGGQACTRAIARNGKSEPQQESSDEDSDISSLDRKMTGINETYKQPAEQQNGGDPDRHQDGLHEMQLGQIEHANDVARVGRADSIEW